MRDVLGILLVQTLAGLAVALIGWIAAGAAQAAAALLGTLAVVVPNGFLGLRLALSPPDGLLRAMWLGEIGKIALTVVLLGAMLATWQPTPLWLLLGFVAAQLGAFAGLLMPTRTTSGA
ncbi:MAG: ATP synthase subunit I [Pseudomonadota bacterium]